MKKAFHRVIALSLGLLILVGMYIPTPAMACECDFASVDEKIDKAEAIFVGMIATSTVIDRQRVVGLNVSKVFKGDVPQSVTLKSSLHSCGWSGRTREEYLIYASGADGEMRTHGCSGNGLVSQSGDAIQYIAKKLGVASEYKLSTLPDEPRNITPAPVNITASSAPSQPQARAVGGAPTSAPLQPIRSTTSELSQVASESNIQLETNFLSTVWKWLVSWFN